MVLKTRFLHVELRRVLLLKDGPQTETKRVVVPPQSGDPFDAGSTVQLSSTNRAPWLLGVVLTRRVQ